MTPNEAKPKSLNRDQLVIEELGTELMIYDQRRNQAFCLNQKAAFVWEHSDGKTTIAEIAVQMAQSLREPIDPALVRFALQGLSNDGLLETTTFLPFVAEGLTRRDMMQKIGVRAAVALPLVTALMVATPKAHASSHTTAPKPPPRKPLI
jgi:Coenzyme PQQ synthesis protein D (PqqD)